MTRITTINTIALVPVALMVAAGPAPAQDDGVATFGSSGNASQYGVTTTLGDRETDGAPEDIATLADDLTGGGLPEIAWKSVSSVTGVETVSVGSLSGDAAQLDDAIADASDAIERIRAGVTDNPSLTAALDEAGFDPDAVIAAYGSSATTIELVIDDRG